MKTAFVILCALLCVHARIIVDEEVLNLSENTNENVDEKVVDLMDENIDENIISLVDQKNEENVVDSIEEKVEEIQPILVSDEDISEEELTEEELERRFGIPLQPCEEYSEVIIPLHISHPETCNQFYKCYNGRAYLMDCPASEHWSVHLDRCDYAPLAKCKLDGNYQYRKRSAKPAQANANANESNADKTNEFLSPNSEEVVDPRCNGGDPFKPLHFQHPADCSKFYKCYLGKAYVIKCPKGQQWASRLNRCDFPTVAKCSLKVQPVKVSAASLTIPKIPECPLNGEQAHFAIQGHPSKFFSCIDSKVFVMECSNGELYDAHLDRCSAGVVAEQKPEAPMFPSYVPQFPILTGPKEELKEDNNQNTFNYNAGHFDSHCPSEDDPMNPTLLANPTDCKRFYKCFAGKAFDIVCPINQEYSAMNKRCDYKVFAQCSIKSE